MKTLMKPALALLAAAALAAPSVLAQGAAADTFKAMDVNGDGMVSQSEYVTHAAAYDGTDPESAKLRFELLAGQDGQLTEAEFADASEVLEPGDTMTAPAAPGETR
ncbi:MAG: hypothetical protein AAF253_02225 [Pseudomonadota bacterium]